MKILVSYAALVVCIFATTAAFAQVEAVLLIARLFRDFDFHIEAPGDVRPAARLTTRPARQVMCRVTRRA